MKKLLALALALLLAFGVTGSLAEGFGEKDPASYNCTLTFMVQTTAQPDYMISHFNEVYPNIKIELVQVPAADLQQKIVNMVMTGEDVTGLTMRGQRLHLRTIRRYCEESISRGDCVNVRDLDVSGTDLVNRGLRGEKVGETLEWLLDIVLENPRLNEKETLMAMLDNRF